MKYNRIFLIIVFLLCSGNREEFFITQRGGGWGGGGGRGANISPRRGGGGEGDVGLKTQATDRMGPIVHGRAYWRLMAHKNVIRIIIEMFSVIILFKKWP
jgi:hypothetical protein